MYIIYLFKEKETGKVIYVGCSSRPSARMKEHIQAAEGRKRSNMAIYKYMNENDLEFYRDIEIVWVDCAETAEEGEAIEEQYYWKYADTVLNDRPGENRDGKYNPKRRAVKCLNDGNVFDTVTACAEFYGKGRTTINRVLAKETPYTWINNEKYHFEYLQ